MIIFRNKGLIDLLAVKTLGVNAKISDSAFGYFGTGLKFAIATILRGGGKLTLYRGPERFDFATDETSIRGKTFKIVTMIGPDCGIEVLGFTTDLGRNWEPWMVLRELGCNALDEGGSFLDDHSLDTEASDPKAWPQADETTFIVDWPALDEAYKAANQIFFDHGDRATVLSTRKVQVADGGSDYIFYRGVRALRLERPSAFAYNILAEQTLTEDRHISTHWQVDAILRELWLTCDDHDLLKVALCSGHNSHEAHLKFEQDGCSPPSRAFINVCLDAQDARNADLSVHAKQAMRKALRSASEEERYFGGYASGRREDKFTLILEALSILTETPDHDHPWDWDKLQFVMVDDADATEKEWAFLENGRIYLKRGLLKQSPDLIGRNVLRVVLEQVKANDWSFDTTSYLIGQLLQHHRMTRVWHDDPEPNPAPEEDPTLSPPKEVNPLEEAN